MKVKRPALRQLTVKELQEQISGLLYEDWFMKGIYNEDDFVDAVIENLEVFSKDERVDFDLDKAKKIATMIWEKEGEALVNERIEKEVKRIEKLYEKLDREYYQKLEGRT